MIKPVKDRVIVVPDKVEERKINGIIIPDMAQDKPDRGVILSVGELATEIKEGDKVIYPKQGGTKIKVDDVEYIIFHEHELLAIL